MSAPHPGQNGYTHDPERFCACGHHEAEHGFDLGEPFECESVQPDRCSCAGFRLGTRSRWAS